MDVPEAEKGCPLSSLYAMLEITSSTEDTIRAMETRLSSLKISSFQGENISTVCSKIRSAVARLQIEMKLPSDLNLKILTVFKTSSVFTFNVIFYWLDIQRKIGSLVLTPSKLLDLTNPSYPELVEKGEWNGNKNEEALLSFSNQDCKDGGGSNSANNTTILVLVMEFLITTTTTILLLEHGSSWKMKMKNVETRKVLVLVHKVQGVEI